MTSPTCKLVHSGDAFVGQQGFTYLTGLTGITAGSRGIFMKLVKLPDGAGEGAPPPRPHTGIASSDTFPTATDWRLFLVSNAFSVARSLPFIAAQLAMR